MPEALGPPLCAEAVRAGSRSPSFNEQFRFTGVNQELLARVCLWLWVTDAWITKPFPNRSGEGGAVPHMPDTHPTAARDEFESKDFIIAFYALSRLSCTILSACLATAPHLTCRNSRSSLFSYLDTTSTHQTLCFSLFRSFTIRVFFGLSTAGVPLAWLHPTCSHHTPSAPSGHRVTPWIRRGTQD